MTWEYGLACQSGLMASPNGAILRMRLGELRKRFVGRKSTRLHFFSMHLLYLDDAGSAGNKDEEYLVLGGISVFEAQSSFLTSELDKLASGFSAANPHEVEFHASEIFSRRTQPWSGISKEEAKGVLKAVLGVLAASYDSAKAFACAVHKASYPNRDPLQLAFEDLCSRFDRYLSRLHAQGDRQRGMIILDESAHETTLQEMARNFRKLGTQWGVIRNLAETPLFVNSKTSRLVQLADHVAYAVFRRYQAQDTQYFDLIASRFDSYENVMHGLAHKQTKDPNCMCPGCMSRRFAASKA
ncbi:MAG: DUF3800 domain-containing protein [Verrucomicrobiales bacterium]|nr:DUF3800 domain-containing protein [Verrucomicrobiales bacterium]